MKLSNLFEDAFQFPLSNKKRFFGFAGISIAYMAIILASTILSVYINDNNIIPIVGLVLAAIFLMLMYGYQLRTIKESIEEHIELPELNNWAGMFIDGVKLFLTSIIYMILPALFILVSLIPVFESLTIPISINFTPDFGITSLILLIIGIVLFILYVLIFPIISAQLAHKGFKSAFNIPEILGRISTYGKLNYFLFIILLILILAALMVVMLLLDILIPIVGQLIAALIFTPFIALFQSRAIALVYRETLEKVE